MNYRFDRPKRMSIEPNEPLRPPILKSKRRFLPVYGRLKRKEKRRRLNTIAASVWSSRMRAQVDVDRAETALSSAVAGIEQLNALRAARQAERQSLQSQLLQAQQAQRDAELSLQDCTLYSSFSGQIARVLVVPGSVVAAGQGVATLQMMDPIKVEMEVSAEESRRLRNRQRLPVRIRLEDDTVREQPGIVYLVDPVADSQTRTFTVTLLMVNQRMSQQDNVNFELAATDQTWRLDFPFLPGAEAGKLYAPTQAIRQDDQGPFLWKVTNLTLNDALPADRLLAVEKMRVTVDPVRLPFLGTWVFNQVVVADSTFDPAANMIVGKLQTPTGDPDRWNGSQVIVEKNQGQWMLRPGDLVEVDISENNPQPGYFVSMDSIARSHGKSYLFLIDEATDPPVVRRTEIRIIDSPQPGFVAVAGGKHGRVHFARWSAVRHPRHSLPARCRTRPDRVGGETVMNLAAWAMRYRPVVLTLVIILTIWGGWTFFTMPRREDPEFTIRRCVVSTLWRGAPTVKVEELVTDKIEEALDSLEEVKQLKSTTINGRSTIYVELEDSVPLNDIQNAWDKIRAKVALVPMPDQNIRPIVNDDFGDMSVLLLAVYQQPMEGESVVDPEVRYSPRELEEYADTIRDTFRLLPGVAKVEKLGVNPEAIYIETDLGSWSKIDLTTRALRQLVASRNIVSSGGSINTDAGEFNLKPEGELDAVNEIESIAVGAVRSGAAINPVQLSDVGLSVRRAYVDPPRVICRFTDDQDSYPAVILSVTMSSGSNIVDVCETCIDRLQTLADVEQILPRDLAVAPVSQQSDNVKAKMSDVINNVIAAIVIVVIVVFLFVGARTSFVMAANIPIVVLISIAVIRWFGVDLEQVTLALIIIALGLLVDNAVQVCDQTRVNLIEGMRPREAAVKAAQVLMLPMLIGTLTTVAAFFPMLFSLSGPQAEYVYSLPVTLSTTLLASWLLAMTVCVILAAAFIGHRPVRRATGTAPLADVSVGTRFRLPAISQVASCCPARTACGPSRNIILRIYGWTADLAIRFKWLVFAASFALLLLSTQLPISSEFFPKDRRDQFVINVNCRKRLRLNRPMPWWPGWKRPSEN